MKIEIRDARVIDPASRPRRGAPRSSSPTGRIAAIGKAPGGFGADETIDAQRPRRLPGPGGSLRAPARAGLRIQGDARIRDAGRGRRRRDHARLPAGHRPAARRAGPGRDAQAPRREPGRRRACIRWARSPSDCSGERLAEMAELAEAGCVGFFQANAPLPDAAMLLQAMRYAATFGFTVWLRPEDAHLARGGVAHDGEVATRLGLPPIPGDRRDRRAAHDPRAHGRDRARACTSRGCRPRRGVALVARGQGGAAPPITCDVGVHHLHLCDRDIGDFDAQCKLVPPLRDPSDRDAPARGRSPTARSTRCARTTRRSTTTRSRCPSARRSPAPRGSSSCCRSRSSGAREAGLPLAATLAAGDHRAGAHARRAGRARSRRAPRADLCLFDPARALDRAPARRWRARARTRPSRASSSTGRVVRTLVGGRTVHGA